MMKNILNIRRVYKKIIIVTNDSFINITTSLCAIFFFSEINANYIEFLIFPLAFFLPLFLYADLYNNILRYTGLGYFFKILSISLIYLGIYLIFLIFFI